MNNVIQDGGNAFPMQPAEPGEWFPGMSLRDWMAGMVAQGLAIHGYEPEAIAERAYKSADAMMFQRDEGR